MANYIDIKVRIKSADNTEFNPLNMDTDDFVSSQLESATPVQFLLLPCATTPGTTIDFSKYGEVAGFFLENTDDDNFVTATWKDAGGNSNSQKVNHGKQMLIPECNEDTDLVIVADTAEVNCNVVLVVK